MSKSLALLLIVSFMASLGCAEVANKALPDRAATLKAAYENAAARAVGPVNVKYAEGLPSAKTSGRPPQPTTTRRR